MEQTIISGLATQGPYALMLMAVAVFFWKYIQKKEEDNKTQYQKQIEDNKEENKAQQDYLMEELSSRDKRMTDEMDKRDAESQKREERLYTIIERQNEVIVGELQEIKMAIERRNASYESSG